MTATYATTAPAERDTPRPAVDDGSPAPPQAWSQALGALGGLRGMVDGGLPPLVFVVVNAVAGASVGLGTAIAAAAATALAVVAVRLVRRETMRPLLGGLIGLAVAVTVAAMAGDARAFFLPGIVVDAAYGVAFLVSAVVGRPLVGTVYGLLFRQRGSWRADPRLRRLFTIATVGWSMVFTLRAGVQAVLYAADEPAMLAAGKLALGWPLTAGAAVLTMAAVSRALRLRDGSVSAAGSPPPVR